MKELGGKTSLGTSAVVAAELARFNAYRDEMIALGPIDSEEKSLALRKVLVKYFPGLREEFQVVGYDA